MGDIIEPGNYCIKVSGGAKGIFISTTKNKKGVLLDSFASGFIVSPLKKDKDNEDGVYNIILNDPFNTGKTFLSAHMFGGLVDLWGKDDGSERQRWIFKKIENKKNKKHKMYNILVAGGVKNKKKYLSCPSSGTYIDLWTKDDDSGRQKWILSKYEPVGF